MTDQTGAVQPAEMPENERLNVLISAGVRGEVTIWDVANELVRSVVYLGSTVGDIKTMSDVKPKFLTIGTSDCVVVCISQASCMKFQKETPYFLGLKAADFITQLAPDVGLYVEGDADAFVLHPPEIAYIKGELMRQGQAQ